MTNEYRVKGIGKAISAQDTLYCEKTESGIYIATGYFLFKLTEAEYYTEIAPITHTDPGLWRYDRQTKQLSTTDLGAERLFLRELTTEKWKIEKTGMLFECDYPRKGTQIVAYYCREKGFPQLFNRKYVDLFPDWDVEFRSAGTRQPAIAYYKDEPFAMIMPVIPLKEQERAIKALYEQE